MTPQDLKREIVLGFFRHGVAVVNTREPFRLASGALSPVYLDHRRIFSVPGLREQVALLWAKEVLGGLGLPPQLCESSSGGRLLSSLPENLVLAGTATAGIAPAYALACQLQTRFAYVRAMPKAHGLGRLVEGVWRGNEPCVVVDDMVTTGGSLLEAAANLRAESANLLLATSITRHDFPSTQARFEAAGLKLVSCFTSRELFSLASEVGLVQASDLGVVLAWLDAQS